METHEGVGREGRRGKRRAGSRGKSPQTRVHRRREALSPPAAADYAKFSRAHAGVMYRCLGAALESQPYYVLCMYVSLSLRHTVEGER